MGNWFVENSERWNAYKRSYYERNRERLTARARELYRENIEHHRERGRREYERNRDSRLEYSREYYKKNKERVLLERRCKKVGISIDDYNRAMQEQGGKCAVCGSTDRLCIDHCHETGVFRGILCSSCNTAEGMLRTADNARMLTEYMQNGGTVKWPMK